MINKKLKDIPEEFDIEISEELFNYSVAICENQGSDGNTLRFLGSGTLVQKENKFGILTAHHCLHIPSPKAPSPIKKGRKLICVIKGGRPVVLDCDDVREVQLAFPSNNEYTKDGPDITFIEILNSNRLSTFKAVGSFWCLNQDPTTIIKKFGTSGHFLANVGFLQADNKEIISKEPTQSNFKFMNFTNSIEGSKVEDKTPWDFINSTCDYEFAESAPKSFQGVSGGGIWSVRVKYKNSLDEFSVLDYCLLGLSFWQTERQNDRRDIRGHYINSIYKSAWR